jgi:hypothetical protein
MALFLAFSKIYMPKVRLPLSTEVETGGEKGNSQLYQGIVRETIGRTKQMLVSVPSERESSLDVPASQVAAPLSAKATG